MTSVDDDRNAAAAPLETGSNDSPGKGDIFFRYHWLIALVTIIGLELACFGPIISKVGFYLDDWITLNLIRWGPHDLFTAFHQYMLSDPRVIVRPVEAFYYVVEFFAFGLKPLGYHVVNAVLEILSAFFLYLALFDLTRRPALSLVAGLILIAYPNHDVTHYWATCSSEQVSLALSLASVFLSTRAAVKHQIRYFHFSVICFLLSIFCYETFLPLVSLNVFFAFAVLRRKTSVSEALKRCALFCVPFAVCVVCLLFYSRIIAPMLGPAQVHAVHLDLKNIMAVVIEGVRINCPPYAIEFFNKLGNQAYENTSAKTLWATFAAISVFVVAAITSLSRPGNEGKQPIFLLPIGLITVVFSYTIFGLNPEYFPTFQTIVNRINEGAAVGIAIAASGLLALFVQFAQRKFRPRAVKVLIVSLVLLPILGLSFFADRGYARPWILSWYTQKVIQDSLKEHASEFKAGDSIILANCPRYVMWAPLFDGVWDFQPMLQLTLKSRDIKGGVVSERMEIQNNQLKDISRGVVCNTYDFSRLFIIIPPKGEIIPIHSAEEFISTVEKRGFGFGLDRSVLKKWRSQLSNQK